jgi:hypothetical protein
MGITRLQKLSILAFLHALLNQLQGLLHVLGVNGILDLVVATQKHRVIAGAHGEGVVQFVGKLFQLSSFAEWSDHCAEHSMG